MTMISKKLKRIVSFVLVLFSSLFIFACNKSIEKFADASTYNNFIFTEDEYRIDENGSYTSKDDVALYIYTYRKLPKNYITKDEAKELGWVPSKNNLGKVAKGKSIGGDVFSNYEKVLPVVDGRKYYECDIDYKGKKRNAKRIVYADDFNEDIGFIYYTDDHYKTFERLY